MTRQANIPSWRQLETCPWVVLFCEGSPSTASPPALEKNPPFSSSLNPPSVHKEQRELAGVIWIIIICAFSASWVPKKVREQYEDRLISVLALASVRQQTIGEGLGPGHSSMARNSSHRQSTTKRRGGTNHAGFQSHHTGCCLHDGLQVHRRTEKSNRETQNVQLYLKKNLEPVDNKSLSLSGQNIGVLTRMETLCMTFIIYEGDFDLLSFRVSLAKAQRLMKTWTSRGEKVPLFSFIWSLDRDPLNINICVRFHGTTISAATQSQPPKSDFFKPVALFLIFIHWQLYLIPFPWMTLIGHVVLKRMLGCENAVPERLSIHFRHG